MNKQGEKTVNALKAECFDIEHEIELCMLKEKNLREALEIKRDRIDRIQMGDSE